MAQGRCADEQTRARRRAMLAHLPFESTFMAYQSVNPFNGQLLQDFETLSDAGLEDALATSAACFQQWKLSSFAQRALVLNKAAELLRAHVDDFAKLATLEMG
jgi:succinate-semialdehyde dehydrogenase/glutarate-semialdehyde dehydrogenase